MPADQPFPKTAITGKSQPQFNLRYVAFISLVSALGGFLFGYDLLVISGAKQFYELAFGLATPVLQGWAVSSCIVGCIINPLSSPLRSNRRPLRGPSPKSKFLGASQSPERRGWRS